MQVLNKKKGKFEDISKHIRGWGMDKRNGSQSGDDDVMSPFGSNSSVVTFGRISNLKT